MHCSMVTQSKCIVLWHLLADIEINNRAPVLFTVYIIAHLTKALNKQKVQVSWGHLRPRETVHNIRVLIPCGWPFSNMDHQFLPPQIPITFPIDSEILRFLSQNTICVLIIKQAKWNDLFGCLHNSQHFSLLGLIKQ